MSARLPGGTLLDIGRRLGLAGKDPKPSRVHPSYKPIPLPDCAVTPGVCHGRVPRDGYRRGMAVEFGRVAERLEDDPLWREAVEATAGRSIMHPWRLANLFLILTHSWEPLRGSHIVEFGSYRGGSALFFATVMRTIDPEAKVHALDTFEGMPDAEASIDTHRVGDFRDADLEGLIRLRAELGLGNLFIHKGTFGQTFPLAAAHAPGFGLAHIDADIHSACSYAAEAVWPHMRRGGYLVFDDATTASCLGATQAAEELMMKRRIHSEQVSPHYVFRAGLSD